MKGKIYTIDEVNKILPLVRPIVTDLVAQYNNLSTALKVYDSVKSDGIAERIEISSVEVAKEVDALQLLIKEVESLGGTVKDYEQGGIDFYGEVDGKIIYFCWLLSDANITMYHDVEQGFSSRRCVPTLSQVGCAR